MTELRSEKFEWFGPSPIEPFNLGKDARLRLVRLATGAMEREVKHRDAVRAVAFSPQGDFIESGCYDGKLRRIRVDTGAVDLDLNFPKEDLALS